MNLPDRTSNALGHRLSQRPSAQKQFLSIYSTLVWLFLAVSILTGCKKSDDIPSEDLAKSYLLNQIAASPDNRLEFVSFLKSDGKLSADKQSYEMYYTLKIKSKANCGIDYRSSDMRTIPWSPNTFSTPDPSQFFTVAAGTGVKFERKLIFERREKGWAVGRNEIGSAMIEPGSPQPSVTSAELPPRTSQTLSKPNFENDTPSADIAKKYLMDLLAARPDNGLEVVSFSKTDGKLSADHQNYEMHYNLKIKSKINCGLDYRSGDMRTIPWNPNSFSTPDPTQFLSIIAGTTVGFDQKMIIEKRERGWAVTKIDPGRATVESTPPRPTDGEFERARVNAETAKNEQLKANELVELLELRVKKQQEFEELRASLAQINAERKEAKTAAEAISVKKTIGQWQKAFDLHKDEVSALESKIRILQKDLGLEQLPVTQGASNPRPIIDALPQPSNSAAGEAPQREALDGEKYPSTRTRLLNPNDIAQLTDGQLRYAINEMFARHGAIFGKDEINNVFKKFEWYHPRPGVDFDSIERSEFTDVERANLKLLGALRK